MCLLTYLCCVDEKILQNRGNREMRKYLSPELPWCKNKTFPQKFEELWKVPAVAKASIDIHWGCAFGFNIILLFTLFLALFLVSTRSCLPINVPPVFISQLFNLSVCCFVLWLRSLDFQTYSFQQKLFASHYESCETELQARKYKGRA